MNKDDSDKNAINYDIDFVDPEDLVGFISDSEEAGESAQEDSDENAVEPEDEPQPEALKFADSIKDSSTDYIKRRQEDTRGRLAIIYTICTFLIFLIVIIVGVIDGLIRHVSIIDNLNTLLPLVSGIFLGTLGFVLGYYFKKGIDR